MSKSKKKKRNEVKMSKSKKKKRKIPREWFTEFYDTIAYDHEEYGRLRFLWKDDRHWLVDAVKVAEILGQENPREAVLKYVDPNPEDPLNYWAFGPCIYAYPRILGDLMLATRRGEPKLVDACKWLISKFELTEHMHLRKLFKEQIAEEQARAKAEAETKI